MVLLLKMSTNPKETSRKDRKTVNTEDRLHVFVIPHLPVKSLIGRCRAVTKRTICVILGPCRCWFFFPCYSSLQKNSVFPTSSCCKCVIFLRHCGNSLKDDFREIIFHHPPLHQSNLLGLQICTHPQFRIFLCDVKKN